MALLEQISQMAARAFCPFLSSASPRLLGLHSFGELNSLDDPSAIFAGAEYARWRAFRDSDKARFVVLTLPRVLARVPDASDGVPAERFRFETPDRDWPPGNETTNPGRGCRMNAAYLLAGRLIDSFSRYGWCANIRGVEGGGRVDGLPVCGRTEPACRRRVETPLSLAGRTCRAATGSGAGGRMASRRPPGITDRSRVDLPNSRCAADTSVTYRLC
jgi:type VI secretion system protein ImpC